MRGISPAREAYRFLARPLAYIDSDFLTAGLNCRRETMVPVGEIVTLAVEEDNNRRKAVRPGGSIFVEQFGYIVDVFAAHGNANLHSIGNDRPRCNRTNLSRHENSPTTEQDRNPASESHPSLIRIADSETARQHTATATNAGANSPGVGDSSPAPAARTGWPLCSARIDTVTIGLDNFDILVKLYRF